MNHKIMRYKTLDIHGMLELEAKQVLEDFIKECLNNNYYKIIVIHGYKKGQVLKNMIWNKLQSKDILEKKITLNPGETMLWLKKPK